MDPYFQHKGTIKKLGVSDCHAVCIMNIWVHLDNPKFKTFEKPRDGTLVHSRQYVETGIPLAKTNDDFLDCIVDYVKSYGMGVGLAPVEEHVLRARFNDLLKGQSTASPAVLNPLATSWEPVSFSRQGRGTSPGTFPSDLMGQHLHATEPPTEYQEWSTANFSHAPLPILQASLMPSYRPAYATPAHVAGGYPGYTALTHRAGWATQAAPATQYAAERQQTPSAVVRQMSNTATPQLRPPARVTFQPLEPFGFPLLQRADQTLAQPVSQVDGTAYDVYPNHGLDDRPLTASPLPMLPLQPSPASTDKARDAVARPASSDAIVAQERRPRSPVRRHSLPERLVGAQPGLEPDESLVVGEDEQIRLPTQIPPQPRSNLGSRDMSQPPPVSPPSAFRSDATVAREPEQTQLPTQAQVLTQAQVPTQIPPQIPPQLQSNPGSRDVSQPPPLLPQVSFRSFEDVLENARTMRASREERREEADRLGREELQRARTERHSAGPSRFHRFSSRRMYRLGTPEAKEFCREIWERQQ